MGWKIGGLVDRPRVLGWRPYVSGTESSENRSADHGQGWYARHPRRSKKVIDFVQSESVKRTKKFGHNCLCVMGPPNTNKWMQHWCCVPWE